MSHMGDVLRIVGVVVTLLAAAFVLSPNPSHAATPAEIDEAIARAQKFLIDQQADGHWEEQAAYDKTARAHSTAGGQWGGTTALATYALLTSGQGSHEPHLRQAIEILKKAELRGTYATAVRLQVWRALPPSSEIDIVMRRDAKALVDSVLTKGRARGMYGYLLHAPEQEYSHSRGQYGVLGLWAAAQMGYPVPDPFWKMVEDGWLANQDPAGGWTYQHPKDSEYPVTPGMTAVGVATLFITQEQLFKPEAKATAGASPAVEAIERGMRWIADHFDRVATDETYPRDYPYATLFAVERIGEASGYKYFGDINWFDKGADWLIGKQRADGSWSEGSGSGRSAIDDTCFGLIFLARGRAPIILNKLQYPQPNWNARPRDAANLTRWLGRQFEANLNWQIVDIDRPVEELNESPILYISGNQSLNLTDEQQTRLRRFIENGGLVLGHADGGSVAFASGLKKLGQRLFPQYAFRELPADHPIYTNQSYPRTGWKVKPAIQAMSNGVRELIVLIPAGDPARFWQAGTVKGKEDFYELAADICLYAVDKKNMRVKGATHLVLPDDSIAPSKTLRVARLQYKGNWDPEPGGWRRVAALMHNQHDWKLEIIHTTATEAGSLEGVHVLHCTGTAATSLETDAIAEIGRFIDAGGLLLVDAAGGSTAFATAIEAELRKLVPSAADALAKPLDIGHPLYTSTPVTIEKVTYRPFARTLVGDLTVPRLRGIERDGRLAIVFSPDDLSTGLVGHPVDGIRGYSPQSATELVSAVLLLASQQKP